MKKLLFCLTLTVVATLVHAQPSLKQNGPMVGYVTMSEGLLWLQTSEAAEVHFEYWVKGKEDSLLISSKVHTEEESAFTAKCRIKLLPSLNYEYRALINGEKIDTKTPCKFKSKPQEWYAEFSVGFGSCAYINIPGSNESYGGDHEIFEAIADKHPDFMLWGGDNLYLRPQDWDSQTGVYNRYTQTRSTKEMQRLLSGQANYACWDDHDYGPNDHNKSWIHKDASLKGFELFWGNPTTGFENERCAVTQFDWGDAAFFILDNRWYRDANNTSKVNPSYFGKAQLDWLMNAMKASKANFKFVVSGGQIISPLAIYENYANYSQERQLLLERIEMEKIQGVIFLSGDRHHTELSKLEREKAYPLYDFTCSPMTSGTYITEEVNKTRVPGTLVDARNFSLLKFSGGKEDRKLTIVCYNQKGMPLWTKNILAKELR